MVLALAGVLATLAADRSAVGQANNGAVIEALNVAGGGLPLVVLIGGMDGDIASVRRVKLEVEKFELTAPSHRRFQLIAIPMANPAKAQMRFPPAGVAYRENPESHYLWRWLGINAPDLVLIDGEDPAQLANALANNVVAGMGRIPARVGTLKAVKSPLAKSEARIELERRQSRSARDVANELASVYGHEFDDAVYVPAMSLIARVRLGEQDDVVRLVAPFVNGAKDSLAKPTPSHLAGHLIFAELAGITHDPRYIDRVRAAADAAMPLHNEMSDAVFMGCPILAYAGRLTGDNKYFGMAADHLRSIQQLCLRPDGLYRHSPLDEAAWGRGNAFPALGLAWMLSVFPKDHVMYEDMVREFQNHMSALARFQDASGMWHEVIDRPASYAEFSATAMIATGMIRGIREGWLDEKSYRPRVARAWYSLLARIGPDGSLLDVCESTSRQKSLDDYLKRAASFGEEARGGGMALLLATELMSR